MLLYNIVRLRLKYETKHVISSFVRKICDKKDLIWRSSRFLRFGRLFCLNIHLIVSVLNFNVLN